MTTSNSVNSLRQRAMVVSLHIRRWGAEKRDEEREREIAEMHNSSANIGRFTKKLMISPKYEEIKSVLNRARSYHRSMTLAWSDVTNERLIMNEKTFEYMIKLGAFTIELERLVDEFLAAYSEAKDKEKIRLNGMYKESDYPHPEIIRESFKIKAIFSPISDANDFRVGLSDTMVDLFVSQLQKETESRISAANNELLDKVRDAVDKMISVLNEPGSIIRETVVGNIQNLMETLPLYNFSGDQHIVDVIEMLRPLCVNTELLKGSDSFRKDILAKAKAVLPQI